MVHCLSVFCIIHGRFLVELGRLALNYGNGVLWAVTETCPQPVAICIAYQSGFAVDNINRPFGAGMNAKPAPIAFFGIDLYDFSYCQIVILL
jgi:hypothetical protein